jgi:hypothetical protein
MGHEGAINRLIQLLEETSDKYACMRFAEILSQIAVGYPRAINCLIDHVNQKSDEYTRRTVADCLGRIAFGNENAIICLIQVLKKTSDEYTRRIVGNNLGKIGVENENNITCLIQLLEQTSDQWTIEEFAEILGKMILNKQQIYQLINTLKPNLKHLFNKENKFIIYEAFYKLIWQYAQNSTYPEFYESWSNCSSVFEENTYFLERDTEKVIKILMLAKNEAHRLGHDSLGTDHILLGIIAEGTNIAAKFLLDAGIKLKTARFEVQAIVGRRPGCSPKEIPFTPRTQEVIDLASLKADQLGHAKVGSIHIFLALISQNESVAIKVLEKLGIDVHQLCSQIFELLGYEESELRTNTSGKDSIPTPTPTPKSHLWQKLWEDLNRPIF